MGVSMSLLIRKHKRVIAKEFKSFTYHSKKNGHFECMSLMNGYLSLEERDTVENLFVIITSKLTCLKSLGLRQYSSNERKKGKRKVNHF